MNLKPRTLVRSSMRAVIFVVLTLLTGCAGGIIDKGQISWDSDLLPGRRNEEVGKQIQACESEIQVKQEFYDYNSGWSWQVETWIHTDQASTAKTAVAAFRHIELVGDYELVAAMTLETPEWERHNLSPRMFIDFPLDARAARIEWTSVPARDWLEGTYNPRRLYWYGTEHFGRAFEFSPWIEAGKPRVILLKIILGVGKRYGDITIASEESFTRAMLIQ